MRTNPIDNVIEVNQPVVERDNGLDLEGIRTLPEDYLTSCGQSTIAS